jgi:hypothetical protein
MKATGCDCLDEADKVLAQYNTIVVRAFDLNGSELAVIATERIQIRRDGKRAKTLIAAFCPICGKAYPKPKGQQT